MIKKYQTLERAVNRVAIPFCIINSAATKLKFANEPFQALFGFDGDTLSQLPSLETYFERTKEKGFTGPEMTFKEYQKFLIEHFENKEEFRTSRKIPDGRYFRYELYPEAEHDIVVTFTDVTDLEVAAENARKGEVAKSEFMANMSHEIRTPMNGVLGMAQILSGTELSDQQEKCVSIIQRSGNALITIINDILDFSKIEAGQLTLNDDPFDLHSAVEDVMSLLAHSAREKNVELVAQISPSLPRNYIGDMGRLRQILINLIGNAIKFTDEGYVKLSVSGKTEAEGSELVFNVEDTGIGIEEHKIGRIFNQFEQADNSTTRLFGGTGLGLTITRRLVEAMGGNIKVTSEIGKGSNFEFAIRLQPANRARKRPKEVDLNNTPILIVDDLECNREIISEQVKQMGGRPIAVSSGDAAIGIMRQAAIKGFRFPVVISDYQMPGMDGLEFVTAVREDPTIRLTQMMVLSSVDLAPLRADLAAVGVHHAINKPATIGDLQAVVSEMIISEKIRRKVAAKKEKKVQKVAKSVLSRARLRILAADDDEVNRMVIQGMLSRPGIELTMVENGEEAVEAFGAGAFDIVLMDIAMPVMDGVTATLKIRELEAASGALSTPIIATTAHAMENDRERFLEAGLDGYLPKPLNKQDLLVMIRSWMKKSHERTAMVNNTAEIANDFKKAS